MKMKTIAFLAFAMGLPSGPGMAQQKGLDPDLVQTPQQPLQPLIVSEYQPSSDGPQIVIRPGDSEVFYEYRVNGQLVEIKVVPEVGPEYYLVPADGGGWIRESETDILVPSWVIFRW